MHYKKLQIFHFVVQNYVAGVRTYVRPVQFFCVQLLPSYKTDLSQTFANDWLTGIDDTKGGKGDKITVYSVHVQYFGVVKSKSCFTLSLNSFFPLFWLLTSFLFAPRLKESCWHYMRTITTTGKDRAWHKATARDREKDLAILNLMEAFFESAPQLALQLYISLSEGFLSQHRSWFAFHSSLNNIHVRFV